MGPSLQRPFLIALLLAAAVTTAAGQSRYYNVWHFGDSSGLDFSRFGAPTIAHGSMVSEEGCASICDPNTGRLLFYTNGVNVWNSEHGLMKGAGKLAGHRWATQSALIVPFPGDSYHYYILTLDARFTNTSEDSLEDRGLNYSIVDMTRDDGRGEVVKKNVPLLQSASERLVGVRHADGCGFWIITHQMGTAKFYVWLLSSAGLSDEPVISEIGGEYHSEYDVGSLEASPDGTMLVGVANSLVGVKSELFRFNPLTGEVEEVLAELRSYYGASFSPDNRFLYAGTGGGDFIYQYDLGNLPVSIELTKIPIDLNPSRDGDMWATGMQLGPDGRIYIAMLHHSQDPAILRTVSHTGVITQPNVAGIECNFQPTPIGLPRANFPVMGLPNCIDGFLGESDAADLRPNVVIAPDDAIICKGESIGLRASNSETYEWFPSEGLSCNDCSDPTASPEVTTTYTVTGFDPVGCPVKDSITITVRSAEISVTDDTVICPGEKVQLTASGALAYMWGPSDHLSCVDCSDPLASPDTTTTFIVRAVDDLGCETVDSVNVVVAEPPNADAGNDATICDAQPVQLHAAGGISYRWSPSSGLSCIDCPDPFALPDVTTTYRVVVTGENGCTGRDSVTVTIKKADAHITASDTVICRGDAVTLTASGGKEFLWSPSEGLSCTNCSSPTATPQKRTTYVVLATSDGVCPSLDSITIEVHDRPLADAGNDATICSGDSIRLQGRGGPDYTWSPATEISCLTCPDPIVHPRESITYYLQVTNESGCRAIDSVRITVGEKPTIDLSADTTLCAGDSIRLTPRGAAFYRWSPSEGLSCTDCPDPIASPDRTTTFHVTGISADGCEARDSIRVTLHPDIVVAAGTDQTICAGETALLSVTGGVRWLWEPADGLSCTDCSDPVASPMTTTIYRVTAWSAEGCEGSDEATVFVRQNKGIVRLRIGRDYRGITGENLTIPVEIVDPISQSDIDELELTLEYDPAVMLIDEASIQRRLEGTALEGWSVEIVENVPGRLTLRLEGQGGETLSGSGSLLRFESSLYLSNVLGTEIPLRVTTSSRCFEFATEPGYARIDSVCGMNFRLIELTAQKYVAPIAYPNPASDRVRFEFGLGLDGQTQLEVIDVSGKRVGLILNEPLASGRYSVEWDVRGVPAGLYWYRLSSGDWNEEGQLRIQP